MRLTGKTTAGFLSMAEKGLFLAALWASALAAGTARAGTVHSCAADARVTVGGYVVGTNYWNQGACKGDQCVDINDKTGDFTVVKSTFTCAPHVASYPFIFYGSHFGSVSPGSILPLPLKDVKTASSSWSFTPPGDGSWNAAYDVWFSKGTSTADGYPGGAELMIWLDYKGDVPPAGKKIGTVRVDGRSWTLWEGPIAWNYIAYLADKPVQSVKNLDLNAFIKDCQSRGFIDKSWYLAAVEAGVELRTGGAPFTSRGFSVEINRGRKGLPSFPAQGKK